MIAEEDADETTYDIKESLKCNRSTYIYIYIYIYILPSTDRLFRCITTLPCG